MPLLASVLVFFLLLWCGSAQALEARAAQRTPLCQEPVKQCVPLFFLQKDEALSVLYRQSDIWLRVQHKPSGREGWVEAEFLNLLLPRRLEKQNSLPAKRMLGLSTGTFAGTFSAEAFTGAARSGEKQKPEPFQSGFLLSSQAINQGFGLPGGSLPVFNILELADKRHVLYRVNPFTTPVRYQTLAHFDTAQDFYGSAQQSDVLIVAGNVHGMWGKAVLVGLDQEQWPLWVIRDLRELWERLPGLQKIQLRADDFKLLKLSPEGDLLVSAYHQKLGKKVLLHWRYDQQWIFQNMLNWPADLKEEAVTHWFVTAGTEALVLAVNTKKQPLLYVFPVGMKDPSLQRIFTQNFKDILWVNQEIWILDIEQLTRWKPQYAPQTNR